MITNGFSVLKRVEADSGAKRSKLMSELNEVSSEIVISLKGWKIV